MQSMIQEEARRLLIELSENLETSPARTSDEGITRLLQRLTAMKNVVTPPICDTPMAECDTGINEGVRKIVKILGGVEHRIFTETGALRLSLGLVLCTVANKVEEWKQDKLRMDYLERNLVEVREHLRYGSRIVFNAYSTHDLEEEEATPSDLRAQTDVQIAKAKK